MDLDLKKLLLHVASTTGVSVVAIRSKSRKKELVVARQLFCRLTNDFGYRKPTEVSKHINRTHSTVITSIKTAGDRLTYDKDFKNAYLESKKRIPQFFSKIHAIYYNDANVVLIENKEDRQLLAVIDGKNYKLYPCRIDAATQIELNKLITELTES